MGTHMSSRAKQHIPGLPLRGRPAVSRTFCVQTVIHTQDALRNTEVCAIYTEMY